MQLRQAIDGSAIETSRPRVRLSEAVHLAIAACFNRHAPLRSITRNPAAIASGTSSRENSCGVAKKTTSTPASFIRCHEKLSNGKPPLPADLRISLAQVGDSRRSRRCAATASASWLRMPGQQAHQLEAGVAGGAKDRGLDSPAFI